MNRLQPYIAALAERTNLPLKVSPGGTFTALLGGKRLLVKALEHGDAILFYMEVGRPTLFRRGEVLTELMGDNLFLGKTRGATLSYDALHEMVGLNLLLPLHQLQAEEFINAFDNLMAAAEEWGTRLETLNSEAEERTRQEAAVFSSFLNEESKESANAAPDMSHMLRI